MNLPLSCPPSSPRLLAVVSSLDHHRQEVAQRFLAEGDDAEVRWFPDANALLHLPSLYEAIIVFPNGDSEHADLEESRLRTALHDTPVFVVR